ncbi:hypothetical protein GFO_1138 [Christiangramia forsetii KT0803]|uniref:Uncharacterized protein n=1 Tax=Christiangramia forsetii (strain DSM 17595 / CGMCC 1.15422 / KT0803) TaxID=411154 RepID=A0M0G7_CHRFK|nr:hypothetical protein GFO_1138 [Christiangramia forsetii KT0803]
MVGNLTIRNVTKEISHDFDFNGIAVNPMQTDQTRF